MSTEHGHDHHENPHAGQGPVLLDIGGDVGALVVTMPSDRTGDEVEIASPGVTPGHHDHVAVVRRPVPGGDVASLVFPELRAGDYDLREKGHVRAVLRVTIEGGQVTTADWPA